jgi:hypothetical protein
MIRRTIAVLACVALSSTLSGSDIYRFGRLGLRLPKEDVGAIRSLVLAQGEPWALLGWYSQVLPEKRYVDVFLAPTVSTEWLRRGPVLHLECEPTGVELACLHWMQADPPGEYVQVADGGVPFSETFLPRTPRESPIRITGEFSDEELQTLVTYIRSSPRPSTRDGTIDLMTISGSDPVRDIDRQADGSVKAWLIFGSGVATCGTFVKSAEGWQVIEVVMGVS